MFACVVVCVLRFLLSIVPACFVLILLSLCCGVVFYMRVCMFWGDPFVCCCVRCVFYVLLDCLCV